MSKEVFQKKVKTTLEEFWDVRSLDIMSDIEAFKRAGLDGAFLARFLHEGCSNKFFKAVNMTAAHKLFEAGHKKKVIVQSAYLDAIGKIAERWISEDLFCDAPLCVDNLSKALAPAVVCGAVSLKAMEDAFQPFVNAMQAKKAIRVLLQELGRLLGEAELLKMYKSSKLDLKKFLSPTACSATDIGDFLNQAKLLFLEPVMGLSSKVASLLEKLHDDEPDTKDIAALLAQTPVDEDSLFSVTRCICEYLTLATYFGVKKMNRREYQRMSTDERKEKRMQRPVDTLLELEKKLLVVMKTVICEWVLPTKKRVAPRTQLSLLYGLQEVAHEFDHPKGMLGNLFYNVYDWEFIEHETFDKWREAVDDDGYSGKQMALPTLSKFFKWYGESVTEE